MEPRAGEGRGAPGHARGDTAQSPENASPEHVGPRFRWDDAGPRAGTRPAAFSPDKARPGRSRTARAVPRSGVRPPARKPPRGSMNRTPVTVQAPDQRPRQETAHPRHAGVGSPGSALILPRCPGPSPWGDGRRSPDTTNAKRAPAPSHHPRGVTRRRGSPPAVRGDTSRGVRGPRSRHVRTTNCVGLDSLGAAPLPSRSRLFNRRSGGGGTPPCPRHPLGMHVPACRATTAPPWAQGGAVSCCGLAGSRFSCRCRRGSTFRPWFSVERGRTVDLACDMPVLSRSCVVGLGGPTQSLAAHPREGGRPHPWGGVARPTTRQGVWGMRVDY